MTCDECRDLLQFYVDREAAPPEKAALDAHLSTCSECTRLHRELEKFTTTIITVAKPLKPGGDFNSRVMARFEETKAKIEKEPPKKRTSLGAEKTFPVWPFAAATAALVAIGLIAYFWPVHVETLATLGRGANSARVLTYEGNAWKERAPREAAANGDQVEAVDAPGTVVELVFAGDTSARAYLRAPCKVQLQKPARDIILVPVPGGMGRLHLHTEAGGKGAYRALRVQSPSGKSWVEVLCGENNGVDVEPGQGDELIVSVKTGSARIGNANDEQTVAEGYARLLPGSGKVSEATQVKPGTFDWLEK